MFHEYTQMYGCFLVEITGLLNSPKKLNLLDLNYMKFLGVKSKINLLKYKF